jgi:aminoglycoside phosphotransferase (APT) family kinase protein
VPRVYWLELDPAVLGAPFFIMERVKETEANPTAILDPRWDGVRASIGRHMYEVLAAIHAFDWLAAHLPHFLPAPAPDACCFRELDTWERVLHANEIRPQPIARAAIRWLRANPPPPAQRVAVVHGDYRVGNLLYHHDGTIHAVIDWETAHLGDPIEDLAWSFMEDWEWAGDGKKGGIIAESDAVAVYEQAGGATVDRVALRWWTVLCGVKAQSLWLSGARAFEDGRAEDLMPATIAWTFMNREDQHLLRALGRLP